VPRSLYVLHGKCEGVTTDLCSQTRLLWLVGHRVAGNKSWTGLSKTPDLEPDLNRQVGEEREACRIHFEVACLSYLVEDLIYKMGEFNQIIRSFYLQSFCIHA
jgi:hypothetical protein